MSRGPAKQFDRDEVLARAMELFWRQGYEATGLTELTEEMGIGRQSLYNAFGDKRSLYLEALARYFDERQSVARSMLGRDGSPLGNLRAFFATMVEMSRSRAHCGCFMGNAAAEFGGQDAELADATCRFFDRLRDLFAETLRRAQEVGELGPEVPVEDVADLLIVTSQGLALLGKVQDDPDRAERLLHTSLALFCGPPAAEAAPH